MALNFDHQRDRVSSASRTITIDTTGSLTVPVGSTLERPTASRGMIRYNTTDSRFEAYDGSVWSGLGGVIDADQNTYIIAEASPGANNNELDFYTNGVRRLQVDSAGNLLFGDSLNKFTVAYLTGNTAISGTLNVSGTTTVDVLNVKDTAIVLNSDQSGTPDADVYITVERGSSNNVNLRWNETTEVWEQTSNGTTYYKILSTDDDYVANITGGTGISVTHTPGAASAATITAANIPNGSLTNSSISITDGTTSQVIDLGETITLVDGVDINVVVSATNTVTINNTSTLDTVTDRGASTTNSITVGGATLSSLTNNRIVFAGLGGVLSDSANLTFDGTILTATAQVNVIGDLDVDNININGNTISSTDTNGNITLTPNGSGDIQLNSDTVRVGDINSAALLTTNGTGNLRLDTNAGVNSGYVLINSGVDGDIQIESNGAGSIYNITNELIVGKSNTAAVVTTNGTGNLTLNTNSGLNSGSIVLSQGVNGDITLTPNGSGDVVLSTARVSDLTINGIVFAGASGALSDSSLFRYDGTNFDIGSAGSEKFRVSVASGNTTIGGTLIFATGVSVNTILDEDNMSSNSASALATQQSIKAYVDTASSASSLTIAGGTGTGAINLLTQTLTVTGTTNEIETSVSGQTITIGLPNNVTVSNNLTVNGNLTINGTTTTMNSTTVTVEDPILTLGGDSAPVSDDNKDRGIEFRYYNGSAKVGFFGYDNSTGYFTFIPDAVNTGEVFSGTKGVLDVISVTGSAANWTTARTITLGGDLSGSVSINGSSDVTLTATVAANSVALGTDTTGNYVAGIVNGAYILGADGGSESAVLTLAVDATSTNTINKVVARDASGNFSAGAISASLSGNATTATALATARNIAISGDVTGTATLFNGSADIVISAGITADSIVNADINSSAAIADTKLATISTAGKVSNSATTATNANTANAIVARDASGNFSASTITAALSGNASTASSWANSRTITLSGDLTGNVSIDGSSDVTLTATIAANNVALGTDTTGDYVASLVAGTGVTLSNNTGESATPTIAIGQDVSTTANVTFNNALFDGSVTIDGNLTVGGTTSTVTAANLSVTDNMIYMNQAILTTISNVVGDGTTVVYTTNEVHNYTAGMSVSINGVNPSAYNLSNQTITAIATNSFTVANTATGTYVSGGTARARTNANPDLGFAFGYYDTSYQHGGFFRDASDGYFKVFKGYTPEPDTSPFIDTSHASFALADIQAANFRGPLVGNATTATTLATARNIAISGDVTGTASLFDGSADITISAGITADSIVNADINSAAGIVDTKLATIATSGKVSNSATTATSSNTNSAIVSRDSSGNFSASTISAALSGNANTATVLQTARTIGGVSFDGSANINLPGVNTTGNQNTTGSAATLATARTIAISGDVTGTATLFDGSADITISAGITADSIVNADINSSAAIDDTKLATIATSGKVSNSATTATNANTASAIVARDSSGNFSASTITAALAGNADTATKWATARTITLGGDLTGNVSIDGSANVTLTATIASDSVALGTDTTGNYVAAGAVSGNGLSGSASTEGATFTVTSNATNLNTPSTIVFRDSSGNFSAGIISAAITGNVTGNVTGNADTATTLAATRTLWGQNFNGSVNVTGNLTSVGDIAGSSAVVITAGGSNQNITITPSGTGHTLLNGNVGINIATPLEKLHVDGAVRIDSTYNLDSATATVASVSQTAIASFSSTVFGGGKIVVQAYDSVTGNRTICELLIVHNGTTASSTEYAIINTGVSAIATYDVDISDGAVRILATNASTNSTQYKIVQTLILA